MAAPDGASVSHLPMINRFSRPDLRIGVPR
jgi:hypothetical protein